MTIYLPLLCFQVYEHVYETVDIQGNPEVRAQATAKVIKHATSFFKISLSSLPNLSYSTFQVPKSNEYFSLLTAIQFLVN